MGNVASQSLRFWNGNFASVLDSFLICSVPVLNWALPVMMQTTLLSRDLSFNVQNHIVWNVKHVALGKAWPRFNSTSWCTHSQKILFSYSANWNSCCRKAQDTKDDVIYIKTRRHLFPNAVGEQMRG